jgi:hypothetical protein
MLLDLLSLYGSSTQIDALVSSGITTAAPTISAPTCNSPQMLYPVGDIEKDSWIPSTGVDLYQMLQKDNDLSYITSGSSPTELELSNAIDPSYHSMHVIRYRRKKTSQGPASIVFRLMQGSTVIASWDDIDSTEDFSYGEYMLSDTEASAISNYDNLSVSMVVI